MPYQPGDTLLDKYRIEALIGQGAFGEVYRVQHLGLKVPRAIKVMRRDAPGVGSTEFNSGQARFQLEAQLGAQLNTPTPHPNLLQIHDFIQAQELLALEMEYVSGGSLADWLEKLKRQGQPMPADIAVQIAREIANGLVALHERDIIHRDLKPGNILFDARGHAKVADLGLAQIPGGPSMRSQLSNPQPHPGTPGYMSPEQENSRGVLRPPSDIYALGVMLFEMLTWRNPSYLEPGTRASSLRGDIPAALDDLLARMLSEHPRERPWNGEKVREQLHQALHTHKQPHPPAPEPPAGPPVNSPAWQENSPGLGSQPQQRESHPGRNIPLEPTPGSEPGRRPSETRFQAGSTSAFHQPSPFDAARAFEEQRQLALDLLPGVRMEFIHIPAGEFWMGSERGTDRLADDNELPQHKVTLAEYFMAKYPVTNVQYQAFVASKGHRMPSHWEKGRIPVGKENHPVFNISWHDAVAFCQWASQATGQLIRLPTEAEWEKTARGPLTNPGFVRIYPWGNEKPDATRCTFSGGAVSSVLGGGKTTPVGKHGLRGASPYGCMDMAGNVWEWVADWYDGEFYKISPTANPGGPVSGEYRVLRGGSWTCNEANIRVSRRNRLFPGNSINDFGFRCACNVPAEEKPSHPQEPPVL